MRFYENALTDPIQWFDKGHEVGAINSQNAHHNVKKSRLSDLNQILFLRKFDDPESNIHSQKFVLCRFFQNGLHIQKKFLVLKSSRHLGFGIK